MNLSSFQLPVLYFTSVASNSVSDSVDLKSLQKAFNLVTSHNPKPDLQADAFWDSFVSRHPNSHFLQTSGWGNLKSRFGWTSHRVTIGSKEGRWTAGAQCLSIRRNGLTMGYVPRGPLVDWQNENEVQEVKTRLAQLARTMGWHFLMIEPDLEDLPANRAILWELGFRPSHLTIQPRSSIRVDLTVSEDELLSRMKSKWRYNIRKANRSGVQIREGTEEDLVIFQGLMEETAQRQGFNAHSLAYHRMAFTSLAGSSMKLLMADVAEDTVAAIVVTCVGKGSWYPWGASSERNRKAMPNFALQHKAMLWAKQEGAAYYDLWGIPEPLGKMALQARLKGPLHEWPTSLPVALDQMPPHDLWNVYRMKQGFGGQIVHLVGAWDLPIQPIAFGIYTVGAKVREQIEPIKKSLPPQLSNWNSFLRKTDTNSVALERETESSRRSWDSAVANSGTPHYMQSWAWGDQMAAQGWIPKRMDWSNDFGSELGKVQVFLKEISPDLPLKMAYVPGGPNLTLKDGDLSPPILKRLEEDMRQQEVVLLRISPNLCSDRANGLGALSRLEDLEWQFSRYPWIHQEREVSNLSDSSFIADIRESRRSLSSTDSGLAGAGSFRCGRDSDFRLLAKQVGQRQESLGSLADLEFGQQIWPNNNEAVKSEWNLPHSDLFLAEDLENKLVGAAMLVAWAESAWYFLIPTGSKEIPPWAIEGLKHNALLRAINRGCKSIDWGPARSGGAPSLIPYDLVGREAQTRRQMVGTWSKILWPLPGRLAPQVLQAVEKLQVPLPTKGGSLHV